MSAGCSGTFVEHHQPAADPGDDEEADAEERDDFHERLHQLASSRGEMAGRKKHACSHRPEPQAGGIEKDQMGIRSWMPRLEYEAG